MQSNLKFSTYLHSQTRKRNCLRWLSPFSSTANLFSLCRLSTGKKHETFGKMKERWKSLVLVTVGGEGHCCSFQLVLIDENCSRLALDVLVASHHSWVWIHSSSLSCEFSTWRMSLVFSFVNLCRLQMPLLKQHGQGGMHFKSFRALKKHPPLTLRQPMKAHFNGKGRPNDFFSPRKPFRFGPWPSEVFLFPRFQRMMKPRLFIFIPDEYNTFHDFLLHPLKWVKLMITETDDRPKVWK